MSPSFQTNLRTAGIDELCCFQLSIFNLQLQRLFNLLFLFKANTRLYYYRKQHLSADNFCYVSSPISLAPLSLTPGSFALRHNGRIK